MKLFIAEKPSLARAIATGIGVGKNFNGYISLNGGNEIVTWCFGHILENFNPDDYSEKYLQWRMEDLPIIPTQWKLNYSMEIDSDTCRDIRRSVQVDFDIASSIPHNLIAIPHNLIAIPHNLIAIPHNLIVMPIPVMDFSESQNTDDTDNKFLARKKNSLLADAPALIALPSTDNITTGTQSVELNLYAQQLTDQLSYSSVNPAAIMEAVHGQYLDYVFNVRVEKSKVKKVTERENDSLINFRLREMKDLNKARVCSHKRIYYHGE